MFQKILTICTGNICRSPLAEAMLKERLAAQPGKSVEVCSAGIGALVGHLADETVESIAAESGISLKQHVAQQVTRDHTRWADLILAMEPHHVQYIVRLDPTARGKTFLLGHWLGEARIDDPYRRSEERHRQTHTMIDSAVQSWVGKL